MKILFVNTNIGYGGASKMMVWVANLYALNGHQVTFFTYRSAEVSQELSFKVNHVHVELEPLMGGGCRLWGTVKYLHTFIKNNNFDVVIGFLSPSQLRITLACIGTSTKILFSQRGDPLQKNTSLMIGKLINWLFCKADCFVFQTEQAMMCYPSSVQKRGFVIANPIVPLKRTQKREGNIEKRIVIIARLDMRQKRQDVLINAFKLISHKHPEYILELYGDGEDEKKLKLMAAGYNCIHFMGKTSDVVGVSQNAAISVLSSDFEGIPNSLLESMSLGIPCVSTNCSPGGAAMLIRDYVNGILVPCDDANELAKALDYMIEHPDKAEDMGKRAMEVNIIYSEDNISKKWLDVLKSKYIV